MPSRLKHGLIISIIITTLFFAIDYGHATVVEYIYDSSGNLVEKRIQADTTAPITTASPPGGTYGSAQSVTLTCNDGNGWGCDKIYYTTDGTTPTTSSPVYSSPITISANTTLKFFARDNAGNSETVKTETYTITCSSPPVKIGGTPYYTLQTAYNAANSGDTIKTLNITINENLTINRNITITFEGGYDCGYTSNTGGTTTIKGITTTAGGGTLTIKNYIISQ